MVYTNRRSTAKLVVIIAALMCVSSKVTARSHKHVVHQEPEQSLESKLTQKAAFVPSGVSALDQLIEVAKHFKIPMGIEWVEQSGVEASPLQLGSDGTVQELINSVLQRAPGYLATINNGMLHIAQPAVAAAPLNPLNLRIHKFAVKEENLYIAQSDLRLSIDMTVHPERYKEGYAGDDGYPPDGIFDTNNITFSGKNLTVREILDRIAKGNGNAMWVVRWNYGRDAAGNLMFPQKLTSARQAVGLSELRAKSKLSPESSADKGVQKDAVFWWEFVPLTNKTEGIRTGLHP